MKVDVDDLVGQAEIAERLGVKQAVVRNWKHRNKLPEPVRVLTRGPIYLWSEVEALELG